MAAPQDKDYAKACGQLASALSISIASARRKVDLVAAKEGVRTMAATTFTSEAARVEVVVPVATVEWWLLGSH